MKLRFPVLIISVALFVASLPLPSITFAHHEPLKGLFVLSWGWWGVLALSLAWYANPAYVAAVIALLRRDYQVAVIASSCAFGLSLSSFFAKQWWFNEGSGTDIAGLSSGFYVWTLSIFVLWVGSVYAFRAKRDGG